MEEANKYVLPWNFATESLVGTCSSPLDLPTSPSSSTPPTRLLLVPFFPHFQSWESKGIKGCRYVLSSSKLRAAAMASRSRATPEPGPGPAPCCWYPEPRQCSCGRLPSTTGWSCTAQSCPAQTCRSWLTAGRTSSFRLKCSCSIGAQLPREML